MTSHTHNKWLWRAWLLVCLFLAGGIWGFTPALARIATEGGSHPLGLTLWQGIIGGSVLLAITVIRGKRVPLSPQHLRLYVICGVVGTALPTTLTFAIAPRIPVSVFSILQALTPLLTYLIAVALRIDGISPIRIAGITLGFVAICLLVGPASASVGSASTVWLLLCLIVPLSYASENNILATIRPHGIDDLTLLSGMLVCAALATLPAVIVMDAFAPLSVPFGRIEWATLGMVVVNVVSYVSFIYLVRITGPVFASQAGYLVVAVGVAVGMLVHDERHSAWVWVAAVLLFSAMALVKERVHRQLSTS